MEIVSGAREVFTNPGVPAPITAGLLLNVQVAGANSPANPGDLIHPPPAVLASSNIEEPIQNGLGELVCAVSTTPELVTTLEITFENPSKQPAPPVAFTLKW